MVKTLSVLWLALLISGSAAFAADQDNRLTDPMRPLLGASKVEKSVASQTAPSRKAPLQLTAVLISPQRSVAVINGESLQKGDVVEGYKLVQIYSDHVVLRGHAGKLVLRRAGTGLKKALSKSDVRKGSKL